MSKNKLIPKIRFSEFENKGEWEKNSIGEVFNSFSGGTPSTSEREYYGGRIPFIRSAEISREKTELFLTEEGIKNSSAKLVNKGDLLVALYGANSGDSAISKINGAINQAILCLQSKYSNAFTYYFLTLNKEWIISKFIQGGQGNLSGDIVKSITVPFPKKEEQQKIASCLSSLDEVIAAHSQKLDLLKDHKKGLMQNLFPQEGEKVPKYRFKEFENEGVWVENSLENISIKIQDGTHFSPKSFDQGDFLYITSKNVKDGYIELSTAQFISKEDHENIYKRCDVKLGDVLLTKDGTIGQACVNELTAPFSLLSSVAFIRLKPSFSNYFLYHLLVSHIGQKEIESQIAGQALKRITLTKINNFCFSFPRLKEQQKIASCLSSLDALIKAQAEKIEQLKLHKKGLMQGLFPKIV